jgi:putative serine protease PepD
MRRSRPRDPFMRLLSLTTLGAALLGVGAVTVVLLTTGAVGNPTTAAGAGGSGSSAASLASPLNPSAIYANAAPGVVAITARGVSSSSARSRSTAVATGTGQIIDTQGDILTASHVIAGASSITVKFQDGTSRRAKVLGADTSTDVAVLKINPSGLTLHPLPLGSSQSLSVGDPLAVIGSPFGYNRSLSTGVVSALDRTIQAPSGSLIAHAIQTDAAINPGNSGGPLLNAQGSVVGIVDQIATGGSGSDSATGVGFAVPIDVVKTERAQLEAGARVTHPYHGVGTTQSIINQPGALIEGVASGSPAAAVRLRPGDLVTAIDGTKILGPSGFVAAIAAHRPGDQITLTVKRGSNSLTLTATLSARPSRASTG